MMVALSLWTPPQEASVSDRLMNERREEEWGSTLESFTKAA